MIDLTAKTARGDLAVSTTRHGRRLNVTALKEHPALLRTRHRVLDRSGLTPGRSPL